MIVNLVRFIKVVKIRVHGNLIKEYELVGEKQVGWDGTGISGQKVESGIYLYRITSGRYQSLLNKIVYIKNYTLPRR